jgi:hypothetical protein
MIRQKSMCNGGKNTKIMKERTSRMKGERGRGGVHLGTMIDQQDISTNFPIHGGQRVSQKGKEGMKDVIVIKAFS